MRIGLDPYGIASYSQVLVDPPEPPIDPPPAPLKTWNEICCGGNDPWVRMPASPDNDVKRCED